MDYDSQVLAEFQNRRTAAQAFLNICRANKLKPSSESNVGSWFQRFRLGDNTLKNEVDSKQYAILSAIAHGYQKFENALIVHKNWKLKCGLILKGRYALYYDNQKVECRELTVVDLFHDQSRFDFKKFCN
jgi:hypothetical protein